MLVFKKTYDISSNQIAQDLLSEWYTSLNKLTIEISHHFVDTKTHYYDINIIVENDNPHTIWYSSGYSNIGYSEEDDFYHCIHDYRSCIFKNEINDFLHILINEYSDIIKFTNFKKINCFSFKPFLQRKVAYHKYNHLFIIGKINTLRIFYIYIIPDMQINNIKKQTIFGNVLLRNTYHYNLGYAQYLKDKNTMCFYNGILSDARLNIIINALTEKNNDIHITNNMLLKIHKYSKNKIKITDLLTSRSTDLIKKDIFLNEYFEFCIPKKDNLFYYPHTKSVIHSYIKENFLD